MRITTSEVYLHPETFVEISIEEAESILLTSGILLKIQCITTNEGDVKCK